MVGSQHAGIEIYLEDFESWVVQRDTIAVTCLQCSEIIKRTYILCFFSNEMSSRILFPLSVLSSNVSYFSVIFPIFRALWADKLMVDCFNIGHDMYIVPRLGIHQS